MPVPLEFFYHPRQAELHSRFLRNSGHALTTSKARPQGNVDPLALEATVARVWDKDRAMRLAELRRDPYLPGWEERRHDKVISEAVLGPTVS